jgi:hypothetical protein
MWIPELLYKILPFVYALVGAALISLFGFSGPSMISAVMLLTASVMITLWRYRPQNGARRSPANDKVRDEWKKRKARRTESMPLDGFQ